MDKIQSASKSFEKKDLEQRAILSQIYSLNTQKRKLEKEVEKLDAGRTKLTVAIKNHLDKLNVLQAEMRDLKVLIAMRVRVAGQIVDSSMKDIVLLAKNPSEIERMIKGLSFMLEKDMKLVSTLQQKRNEYIKAQEETTKSIKELTAHKQEFELKMQDLEKLNLQKRSYIAKIQKDKKYYLSLLEELRKKGEDTMLLSNDERVGSLFRKNFFEYKKTLEPPTRGRVAKGYGPFDGGHGVKLFSKGIYFEVDEIKDVTNVAHGTVVFIGNVKDFKNTVVVDHGNHYYTVYSLLSDVSVKVGQTVEANQVIAKTGKNPYLENNGIYFEIRHFSDPLNPDEWLNGSFKAISKNQSSKEGNL